MRELQIEREDGPLARVVVSLPAGEGYLLLRFEDTPLRQASKWISTVFLLLLAGLVLAWIRLAARSRGSRVGGRT